MAGTSLPAGQPRPILHLLLMQKLEKTVLATYLSFFIGCKFISPNETLLTFHPYGVLGFTATLYKHVIPTGLVVTKHLIVFLVNPVGVEYLGCRFDPTPLSAHV